jgi:hypothetical protein
VSGSAGDSILAAEEDAAIRAALARARTPDELELVGKIIEERERSRRTAGHQHRRLPWKLR